MQFQLDRLQSQLAANQTNQSKLLVAMSTTGFPKIYLLVVLVVVGVPIIKQQIGRHISTVTGQLNIECWDICPGNICPRFNIKEYLS